MQFSTILTALLTGASVTMATPAMIRQRAPVCTGLDSSPLCCATDVLGVADLNCAPPPTTPTDMEDFISICAAIGQQAKCCAIPVLEQALICSPPA